MLLNQPALFLSPLRLDTIRCISLVTAYQLNTCWCAGTHPAWQRPPGPGFITGVTVYALLAVLCIFYRRQHKPLHCSNSPLGCRKARFIRLSATSCTLVALRLIARVAAEPFSVTLTAVHLGSVDGIRQKFCPAGFCQRSACLLPAHTVWQHGKPHHVPRAPGRPDPRVRAHTHIQMCAP